MTTNAEGKPLLQSDQLFYNEQIAKITQPILPQFDRLIKSYVYFNLLFIGAGTIEIILLLLFFTFLSQSSLLAFGLALIFLTFFSYFIFRIYFLATKPENFEGLKNQFIDNFKTLLHYQEGVPEHHLAVAVSCSRLSDQLTGKEFSFYRPPQWLDILSSSMEKFSYWWHWQDLMRMRELLLKAAVEEHIKLVRSEPINLEFHAALANAYVMLASLYSAHQKRLEKDEDILINFKKYSKELERKFRLTSEKAIEELKILNEYSPNDPWVHLQLAYSYHDLSMPLEEIREYEILLKLNPEDKESVYKLGSLYFQQGMNAKGLRIYEDLKRCHYKKAENLLKLYSTEKSMKYEV